MEFSTLLSNIFAVSALGMSASAQAAGQVCTSELIAGSCTAVCSHQDEYGTCTSWTYTGCKYKQVCTTRQPASAHAFARESGERVCKKSYDDVFNAGDGDKVGKVLQDLNFPNTFSVKNSDAGTVVTNLDPSCK